MDGLTLEIYSKLIGKRKRKMLEWSLKTVTILLWAQVSQLTFIYLLRLAITPYWP